MSFPKYDRYKDSGVEWLGEVPKHWEIRAFRRALVSPLSNGIFKKKEYFGNGILLINVFDIYQNDYTVKFENLDRVQCTPEEILTYQVLPEDLFFVRSSLKQEGIGVVAIAEAYSEPVVFECHLIKARPNSSCLHSRYSSYVFNSTEYRGKMIAMAKVTTMTTIDQESILSMLLLLPPLPEQRSIATFLDRETTKIDELIAEQRQLIDLLKEKRQAVISHAVTKGLNPDAPMKDSAIEWLGEVPEHWEVIPLGNLAIAIQTGPFGSQLHSEDYVDGQTPVINPSNIQEGKIIANESCTVPVEIVERLSHHILRPGDVIFGRRGEMGRCAMVTDFEAGWLCGTGCLNVRLSEKALPEFVTTFLRTSYVRERLKLESVGSTMDNLNTSILASILLPAPPIDEQRLIAAFLDRETAKFDELIAEAHHAIALLQERRTALISAAVTGKIDVRSLV